MNLKLIHKKHSHQVIRNELDKISDLITIKNIEDKYYRANIERLYAQRHEPSLHNSLFQTEFENMRHKKYIPSSEQYTYTTLEYTQQTPEAILSYIIPEKGLLRKILDRFQKVVLPSTSAEQDALLKRFINAMYKITRVYYNLDEADIQQEISYLIPRDIRSLITNLVFSDNLYSIIYETKKKEQKQSNAEIQSRMAAKRTQPFNEFGIDRRYTLDENTREMIKSKCSTVAPRKAQDCSIFSEEEFQPVEIVDVDSAILPQRPQAKELEGSIFQTCPYQNAIDLLNSIQYRTTPHHKLRCLHLAVDCIYNAITDYYSSGNVVKMNPCPDDLVSIFCYVLSRSNLQNPYTHFDIMMAYCDEESLKEHSGVVLTVFEAALQLV